MIVKTAKFEDLSKDEQEDQPNNGAGKEYASYLVIEDKDGRRVYSDAMEPEDARFCRDLSWIVTELKKFSEDKK